MSSSGSIDSILKQLDAWASDPEEGLPEALFLWISRVVPLTNVDLIVKDEAGHTLLTWRDDEIYGSGWHVPGSIIRYRERIEERIHATALTELGVDIAPGSELIGIEEGIECERRERSHFIALVYRCRLAGPPDEKLRWKGGTPQRGQWAWHAGCPENLIPAQAGHRKYIGA